MYSAAPMPFLVRAEVVAELKAAAQLLILHGSLQLAPARGGALFEVEGECSRERVRLRRTPPGRLQTGQPQ